MMKFIYSTDGEAQTTQFSLASLGEILSHFYDNIAAVIQVNTQNELCGFAIITLELSPSLDDFVVPNLLATGRYTMYFTGLGFRTDEGGEGGRGYKEALKLLDEFKIYEITISYPLRTVNFHQEMTLIIEAVEAFWEQLQPQHDPQCVISDSVTGSI